MPLPKARLSASRASPALGGTAKAFAVALSLPWLFLAWALDVGNLAAELFKHGPNDRILFKSGAQFRTAPSPRCCPAGIQFNTDAQRLAHHLIQNCAQTFHRVARLQHFRERAALCWKKKMQFASRNLPARGVLH